MAKEVHLERLLGKRVLDQAGKQVGRIEEVQLVEQDGDCVVQGYLLGHAALLRRLSVSQVALQLFRHGGIHGYVVPWDKLDLSDPDHPRLRCGQHELETFGGSGDG